MARIAGVNIPTNKRVVVGLQYIHGIGPAKAKEIMENVSIPEARRVSQLTDQEVLQLREVIDRDYVVEGDLRREVAMNIKRLMDLGLLPWVASSSRPAGSRSANPYQRTHPQGSRQADRRQEEISAEQDNVRHPARAKSIRKGPGTSKENKPPARPPTRTQEHRLRHCPCECDLQQHDDHDHRCTGQHHRLVVGRRAGVQGLAKVDALRGPGRRGKRRQEGSGAWHERASESR